MALFLGVAAVLAGPVPGAARAGVSAAASLAPSGQGPGDAARLNAARDRAGLPEPFMTGTDIPRATLASPASSPPAPDVLPRPTGTLVGQTDPQQVVQVTVALKVHDPAALDSFLQQLYDSSSPTYKQFLTPAEFTNRFIDPGARTQVDAFLQSAGLTVQDSGVGSLVHARGTAAQVQSAFQVRLANYRTSDGRVYFANDRTPTMPATVSGSIQAIVGLDNLPAAEPRLMRPTQPRRPAARTSSVQPTTATGCPAALSSIAQETTGTGTSIYTPNQFATAYNFTGVGNGGTGQTVALYELDNYLPSNVSSYQSCFGTSVPLQNILVDESTAPAPGSGEGEVELDIDTVVGLAPHISKLLVYEAPNNGTGPLDEYQQIANDNTAQVVSSSWGECERTAGSALANAENTIYAQMATQGQSLFDAAGDTGSSGCARGATNTPVSVDMTAGSPNVTGVGGTTLSLAADNTSALETAWNEFATNNGASGGGVSTFFSRPSYQTGVGTTRYSTTMRQVPDVAADSDPLTAYLVFTNDPTNCPVINSTANCFEGIAGTSAATPLWAAGMAAINADLVAHGQRVMGLANPALYAIFNSSSYASAFQDIAAGSNCYIESSPPVSGDCGVPGSSTGLYRAGLGYDPVTGLGSPNFGGLATALISLSSSPTATASPAQTATSTSAPAQTATPTASPTRTATSTVTSAPAQTATATPTATSGSAVSVTLALQAGWNLVALPLSPSTPSQAQSVLAAVLASSGGSFAELASWNGIGWTTVLDQGGTIQGAFALVAGKGYFLFSDKPASLTFTQTP